ncbi:response regulator transcription factor [Rhodococcus fascians]|jgi:DNA-binding NarL/FixJ family response regulator|uniref:response regulator n=1 Tax=Rhodococcoides fascians TaxID=1828 RepID=UPI0024B67E12|nr:response regulator transcription factor [Rhodococcus fascians]MDJ0004855.1 response regulator transcription factor [Rhodococcus fascians]
MDEKVRVVLAEDNTLLRVGMIDMLDKFGFEVVRAVSDKRTLIEAVRELRPALLITDIRMPPGFAEEGLEAAVELRRELPGLPIVALSHHIRLSYIADLLDHSDAAGIGYLLKDRVAEIEDFIEVLRVVIGGGTVVDPTIISALLRKRTQPTAVLSPREREVLTLLAEGHSNIAVAQRLVVTEAAVAKHIGNIFSKLGLPPNADQHRRVLAVLTYLRGQDDGAAALPVTSSTP